MAGYVIRFSDFTYYNINHDEEWVRFMATMDKGSFFSEVPRVSARVFRESREKFRARVLEAIEDNLDPQELFLEDAQVH